jgi:hypothetical protein
MCKERIALIVAIAFHLTAATWQKTKAAELNGSDSLSAPALAEACYPDLPEPILSMLSFNPVSSPAGMEYWFTVVNAQDYPQELFEQGAPPCPSRTEMYAYSDEGFLYGWCGIVDPLDPRPGYGLLKNAFIVPMEDPTPASAWLRLYDKVCGINYGSPYENVPELSIPWAHLRFKFRGNGITSSHATIWGMREGRTMEPPLFDRNVGPSNFWTVLIPPWVDNVLIEFVWFHTCGNKSTYQITVAKVIDGKWSLQPLPRWLVGELTSYKSSASSERRQPSALDPWPVLELPTLGDTTGVIQNVYGVVNLETWLANAQPLQESYSIVDGASAQLPGFLIGSTPIVFDSLASPAESPFSTTPVTAELFRDSEAKLTVDCQCPAQCDFDFNAGHDAIDLAGLIDILFAGAADLQDPPCPVSRADFNNDGFADVLDLTGFIDYLFAGGAGPCDPCNPVQGTCLSGRGDSP